MFRQPRGIYSQRLKTSGQKLETRKQNNRSCLTKFSNKRKAWKQTKTIHLQENKIYFLSNDFYKRSQLET